MADLIDNLMNPPAAVVTTGGVTTAHMVGIDLPFIINVGTAIYLGLLIIHKGWQMYKDWKKKDAPLQ